MTDIDVLWLLTFAVLGFTAFGLAWLGRRHKKTLTLKDFCE